MVQQRVEVSVIFDDIRIINESYVLYGVNVKVARSAGSSVKQTFERHVFRRYSEFWDLKNRLEKEFQSELPYELPHRGFGLWSKSKLSSEVIESRKVSLAQFLHDMLNDSFDTKWKNSLLVANFLKLPAGWNNQETNTHADSSRDLDMNKLDLNEPSQWLISFRDCKTLLFQCTKEPGSDGTKNLMKLRLSLYHLENALDQTRQSHLLTGTELSRRASLLQALKKDINELAVQSGIGMDNIPNVYSNDGANINSVKTALFTGTTRPRSPKKPVAGRRKFGETEETLLLNNQQLLQLHKDEMAEQDQELQQMRKVIQRQKALSLEMNQELSQQNDLLDLLDGDIDRTSTKLRTANRKAKRFNSD